MMCTWLSEQEFELYSTCPDKDVNEVLQEVRKISPLWFVSERTYEILRWFRKPVLQQQFTVYEIYQYPHGNFSKPEVRIQMSANTKSEVLNFLYGLNVGLHFSNIKDNESGD